MLSADTRLSHYRILKPLGSGGMADVYEAVDERLGRHVALKVLPSEFGRNPSLVARFETEVRAAASLNHHGIVSVFEVGHDQGLHFFSMRLLTGGDLRQRIDKRPTQTETLAILREVADAFSHAHARNFVHRDVKPENIMFDEQGYPVLTDFGIAKALESGSSLTATGVSIGTPRYISPEQARGLPVDARADLYSLGVILYEMLTGQPPYDADESLAVIFKHVTEPIPKLPPEHAGLQPLLELLMAKDPAQRPSSARELVKLIDAYVRRLPAPKLNPDASQQNPLVTRLMATPSPRPSTAPATDAAVVEKAEALARAQQEESRRQEEMRRVADAARKQQEEQTRLKAEADERVRQEALRKAEQDEARRQLEAQAQLRAQEEARQAAEAEARKERQRLEAEELRTRKEAEQQRDQQPRRSDPVGDEDKTLYLDQAAQDLVQAQIDSYRSREEASASRKLVTPAPAVSVPILAAKPRRQTATAESAPRMDARKPAQKLWRAWGIAALALLGLGAAIGIWLSTRPAADVPTVAIESAGESAGTPGAPMETTTTVAPEPAALQSPAGSIQLDDPAARVASLLAAATVDRQAGRDTAPPGDNALEKYRAVLIMQPAQTEALTGIREIADRQVNAARLAIERSDFDRAQVAIDQIAAIQPEALGDLREQLQSRRAEVRLREEENARKLLNAQRKPVAGSAEANGKSGAGNPAATARTSRSRTASECADLLTKFGLGEELSAKQRDFIKKNC
jgi:tRNA A-37 threonylcarbamoyl transferase component Bud32